MKSFFIFWGLFCRSWLKKWLFSPFLLPKNDRISVKNNPSQWKMTNIRPKIVDLIIDEINFFTFFRFWLFFVEIGYFVENKMT